MKSLTLIARIGWGLIWKGFSVLVILLAIGSAFGKLLIPFAENYQTEIENWLSVRLDQDLRIERLEARWTATGPYLELHDFSILDEDQEPRFSIDKLDVSLSLISFIFSQNHHLFEFHLSGVKIAINRKPDGSFEFDMPGAQSQLVARKNASKSFELPDLGNIRITKSQLFLSWSQDDFPLVFEDVNLLFQSGNKETWLVGNVQPLGGQSPFHFRVQQNKHTNKPAQTRIYFQTDSLKLNPWSQIFIQDYTQILSGEASLEAWIELSQNHLKSVQARFNVADLTLEAPSPIVINASHPHTITPRTHLDELSVDLLYKHENGNAHLQLKDLTLFHEGRQNTQANLALKWDKNSLVSNLTGLNIAEIDQLFRVSSLAKKLEPILPYESSPKGLVNEIQAQWFKSDGRWVFNQASAQLQELSLLETPDLPGFSGLQAHLTYQDHEWQADIKSQQFALDLPKIFKQTLNASSLDAKIRFSFNQTPYLDIERFTLANQDLQAQGRFFARFPANGGKPFIDMMVDMRNIQVPASNQYWPINIFEPPLLNWLDQALIDGKIPNAVAVLHGDLNDFPFKQHQGRFNIQFNVEDASLRFLEDWPIATNLQAEIEFDKVSMSIPHLEGNILDLQVKQSQAFIEDLGKATVELDLKGEGQLSSFQSMLDQSPVHKTYQQYRDKYMLQGWGETELSLSIPLLKRLGELKLDGHINLKDAELNLPPWDLKFNQLSGAVHYSQKGFDAKGLQAKIENRWTHVDLSVAGHCLNPRHGLEANLKGQLPSSLLLSYVDDLKPLSSFLPGESEWNIDLNIPNDQQAPILDLSSDLVGISSHLPQPLSKSIAEAVDFSAQVPLDGEEKAITVKYGDIANIQLDIGPNKNHCVVHLGPDPTPMKFDSTLEEALMVQGHTHHLDLTTWLAIKKKLFGETESQDTPWLDSVTLKVDKLQLFNQFFDQVNVSLSKDQTYWNTQFDSEAVKGQIQSSIYPGAGDALIAEFEHLYWPTAQEKDFDSIHQTAETINLSVSDIPRLHLYAKKLYLGQAELGETRIEAYPIAQGVHIEKLNAQNANFNLTASGDWTQTALGNNSQFQIHITAESLGDLLNSFGYQDVFEGGQTIAQFNVSWEGPPTSFTLAKLGGELEIDVQSGQILDVNPGAGRIFGLLSLQELPRRLFLDFRDVFQKGLSFDNISGRFTLQNGLATTDDLLIKSRSAQIILTGKTHLAEQTYDQTVFVVPKVGQALPVVGAITGGAVGAAAMLAVQGILGKALNQSNQLVYQIKGPWDKPKIERMKINKNTTAIENKGQS